MIKKILFSIALGLQFISLTTFAQVGVDNPAPSPYSILDLKATDKGLLVPRMTTSERFAIRTSCSPSCPEGLMVYDTDKQAFFYLKSNDWYILTPFNSPDVSVATAEDMSTNTTLVADVGIGVAPAAGYKLDVNGKSNLRTGLDAAGNITVSSGNIDVQGTGTIGTANGNISSTNGNIVTTNGDVNAYGFSSDTGAINVAGPVPKGGIIMWSGAINNIPSGWRLCDGTGGTPDLKGRFVVGYNSGDTDYDNIGDYGGEKTHLLSIGEMPVHNHGGATGSAGDHSHTVTDKYDNQDCKDGAFVGESGCYMTKDNATSTTQTTNFTGAHTHSIPNQGSGQAHENRPPYYTLAYIMKL